MRKMTKQYMLYGLVVESAVELPELVEVTNAVPDVEVRLGEACLGPGPVTFKGLDFATTANSYFLEVDGVAKYSVTDGSTIVVEPIKCEKDGDHGPSAADVRLFLLGSCFGALLHQRGELPIHMSAVHAPSGVWGFTGPSGAGKSTLAGWLHCRHGWQLVSDDVAVIRFQDGVPLVYPGPRRLKLWEQSLEAIGLNLGNAVQDLSNTPKFQLYLNSVLEFDRAPLCELVLLERDSSGEKPRFQSLSGAASFDACIKAVYRPVFVGIFRDPAAFFRDIVMLCAGIRVSRFVRPWDLKNIEYSIEPLVGEMDGQGVKATGP